MNAEQLTALGTILNAIVIGATAVAALVQLRHLRASNQLDALLSLERDFRSAEMQAALRYVQDTLPEQLRNPEYRAQLARIGFIDARVHPEVTVCNWFDEMGTLMKHHLVTEATFMDLFGRLIRYYWGALETVVAIMRRSRGDSQYHDFEYLAIRAHTWLQHHPRGLFPRNLARLVPNDPWLDADGLRRESSEAS